MQPFRFGYQLGDEPIDELIAGVQAADAAGFDVVHTSDHIGGQWAPLTTLAAIGVATTRVRLCPLVINNDFWHPVLLAREVVALDHLTNGRVELGLGAGHSFTEYEAMGLAFDPPKVRKARLAESVEILRRLLDGESRGHDWADDARADARGRSTPRGAMGGGSARPHRRARHNSSRGFRSLGSTGAPRLGPVSDHHRRPRSAMRTRAPGHSPR